MLGQFATNEISDAGPDKSAEHFYDSAAQKEGKSTAG